MAYVETCKHRGPHVGPCTECMKEKIAAITAERDELREEVDKYNFRVSYKCPECGAYHLAPDVKGDEIKALKARLALADKVATDGNSLSEYAASIHWGHRETNTADWLDGLREKIMAVQTGYAAYRKG